MKQAGVRHDLITIIIDGVLKKCHTAECGAENVQAVSQSFF